ncbi:glutaminase [uncultured Duncaniella sp.]|jgi:glutaminase|uniref:glutaminase n=1 Tax=uncultured Duncaniella sp. TaxID=2768039 RepID=UPI0026770719|nr:glutaminase [uncultured Duncaniella sp.]MCI9172288.1 glutaminase [Muribaculaceae bacterium]
MDYNRILAEIAAEIEPLRNEGRQADYIPALAEVNPDRFGMCITSTKGDQIEWGDVEERFSIQSITKVFSLSMALSIMGEDLWERVGKEPSGSAFNSLVQLELDHGVPRNPFINAGAIVVADVLLSRLDRPQEQYIEFIRQIANDPSVDYDRRVAYSEREKGYVNAAIANMLKYYGNLNNDIEEVLRFYFLQCSVEMNCRQLSRAFLPFADRDKKFSFGNVNLTYSQVKRINAIMQTCGFYNDAGEYSYLVGLPGKSGVGGGIGAVYPGRYAVATWSPRLNVKGNSVMGMKALELLTTYTHESIF